MEMSNAALIAVGLLCAFLAASSIVHYRKSDEKIIYPILKCLGVLAFAIYLLLIKS